MGKTVPKFLDTARGQMSIPPAKSGPGGKIPPAPWTNQIADLLNSARSRTEKKNKNIVMHVFSI